jgi:hypothetical protein
MDMGGRVSEIISESCVRVWDCIEG